MKVSSPEGFATQFVRRATVGLSLLGLACGSNPAHAGHWEINFDCSGTTKGSYRSENWPATTGGYSNGIGTVGFAASSSNYGNGLSTAGTVTPVLKWKLDDNGDGTPDMPLKRPDALYIHESAEAVAEGYETTSVFVSTPGPHYETRQVKPTTLTAADGLGDPPADSQDNSASIPRWIRKS